MHTEEWYVVLKDVIQALSWLAAAVGVWFGGWKAIRELSAAAKQRDDALAQRRGEERWKRAELARLLHKDALASPLVQSALVLLEWDGAEHEVRPGEKVRIDWSAMESAMRVTNMTFGNVEGYVRRSFDALFDEFAGLEHGVLRGLLDFEDVDYRWRHYAKEVAAHPPLRRFAEYYGLTHALNFLRRFEQGVS
jgi:hypothetical protein